MTRRLGLLAAVLGALLLGGALHALRDAALRRAEAAVARRAVAEAARRGLALEVHAVRLSWPLGVTFEGLTLSRPGRFRLELGEVTASFRLRGRGVAGRLAEVATTEGVLAAGNGLEALLAPSTWKVLSLDADAVALRRLDGAGTVRGERRAGLVRLRLEDVDVSSLVRLRRHGRPLGDAGRVHGVLELRPVPGGGLGLELNASARGARLPSLGSGDDEGLGQPTDLEAAVAAELWRDDAVVDVTCARVAAAGAVATGSGRLAAAPDDLLVEARLEVGRVDLAALLAASGLDLPAGTGDLGSAAARVRVTGRLRDPRSFAVDERIDFTPPSAPVPALERLRGPFVHQVERSGRPPARLVVGPGSPDYVALADVPPLLVRALLVAEDANFHGHPGIDLHEIPVALATNWVRGEKARGASTLTQQLAKNLFLSREKSYGRKLQEAALALLLDRSLGKARVLETYLNVIEWGPDLYGLRPAACRYFGKEPSELTPKEIAFLVTLIPGPVKYQRAFAGGTLSPRFEAMVNTLLYRLRSVDALTEEAYEAARAEVLALPGARPQALAPGPAVDGGEEPGGDGPG